MPHDDLDGIVERMLDGSEHSRRQFIRHLAGAGLLVGPGSAFLAACGGVKGEKARASRRRRPSTTRRSSIGDWTFSNWPLYIDKSVLKSLRQEVRRPRQVRRGHQRQLRVLREGPPAAAGGQADRPRHRRAHRLHGRALGARRLRHGDRQEQRPERQEPRPRARRPSTTTRSATSRCRGSRARSASATTRARRAASSTRSRTSSTRSSRAACRSSRSPTTPPAW